MGDIYYKYLADYLGNSNYVIGPKNPGDSSNASGLGTVTSLGKAVADIQKMVDFNKKQINVNIISNYDTTPIQVVAPLNLSNVNLFQNGSIFVAGSGGSSSGPVSAISSGTNILTVNSTSTPTSIAFNFASGSSNILTLSQQGTLSLPYGAIPNTYLKSIDLSGTTAWNYVSNLTMGLGASLNVLGNNSFSFQQSGNENASLDTNGNMTANNFFSVSDERYKKNISTIVNAGDLLKQIRGVSFDWRKDNSHDIGVIAQEVYKVMPEAIVSTNTNMLTVAYTKIIPLLIETIKDLQKRVEVLEGKC
jgi:hypothetical protein